MINHIAPEFPGLVVSGDFPEDIPHTPPLSHSLGPRNPQRLDLKLHALHFLYKRGDVVNIYSGLQPALSRNRQSLFFLVTIQQAWTPV